VPEIFIAKGVSILHKLTVVAPIAKTIKFVREVMVIAIPALRIVTPISSTIGRSLPSADHKYIVVITLPIMFLLQ
jgi:hypothetical protein